jgi:hypothetical protein
MDFRCRKMFEELCLGSKSTLELLSFAIEIKDVDFGPLLGLVEAIMTAVSLRT